MQLLTAAMPDTIKERDRRVTYLASNGTCPEDGVLTVHETTGTRVVRTVSRRYAVEEDLSIGSGFAGRVFHLAKLAHCGESDTCKGAAGEARTGEVYRVAVSHDGRFASCDCKAGNTRGPRCVHRDSMRMLLEIGLEDPRESGCDRMTNSGECDWQPEPADSYDW